MPSRPSSARAREPSARRSRRSAVNDRKRSVGVTSGSMTSGWCGSGLLAALIGALEKPSVDDLVITMDNTIATSHSITCSNGDQLPGTEIWSAPRDSNPEPADQESILGRSRAFAILRKRALTCGRAFGFLRAQPRLLALAFAIRLQTDVANEPRTRVPGCPAPVYELALSVERFVSAARGLVAIGGGS